MAPFGRPSPDAPAGADVLSTTGRPDGGHDAETRWLR